MKVLNKCFLAKQRHSKGSAQTRRDAQDCPDLKRPRLCVRLCSRAVESAEGRRVMVPALKPLTIRSNRAVGDAGVREVLRLPGARPQAAIMAWPARESKLTAAKPHSHRGRKPNTELLSTWRSRPEKTHQQWPWLSPLASGKATLETAPEKERKGQDL